MADAPVKVNVQSRRVDLSILPDLFSLPYKLYVIQQNTDMLGIADAANNAGELAYEATVKNEEQDITLADHEGRISALRIEVDDHEIRITGNTSAISSLTVRVTNAEGNITTLQADVSTLQTNVSSLTTRVTTAEGNITTLQGDYVSKSAVASQTLASPINVTTSYSVGGTKVVGARNTGWTASTGTASKAGINGSTTYTVSAAYTQAEVQAIATGLQQVRQLAVALQTALGAASGHGLINA
ncbi:phage tail protein [Enterobacter sp. Z1]|uniref:phage tail protein n=1 Tax=Enterobacter sp. Z1 TaxID=2561927 RepID=UPI0011DF8E79|nr:phage tail protein [Enterobacter sp. Z1]TYD05534.1 phage tail protein [Enterobacter sp. Z1]USX30364.1 phage tail protein [Enterobacter sp. Z1]